MSQGTLRLVWFTSKRDISSIARGKVELSDVVRMVVLSSVV